MSEVLKVDLEKPDPQQIEKAVQAIRQGAIAATSVHYDP